MASIRSTRRVSAALALAATLFLASDARAHDVWADGSPIPPWVKTICCGPSDAHRLTPDQVHRVDGGYRVDGAPVIVPSDKALPSQDGEYWIFYNATTVHCFFIPASI